MTVRGTTWGRMGDEQRNGACTTPPPKAQIKGGEEDLLIALVGQH